MSDKDAKTTDVKAPDSAAQEVKPLSAAELLEMAAQTLERRRAPRSPKHYKMLADEVRALLPRAE